MYVEKCLNNGIGYLRLVKSERYLNSKGVKTARKVTVFNIGPLSRFDDGLPNYVERLKKSYKDGTPIIDSLYPHIESALPREKYTISFQEGDPDCIGEPKLYCQVLLERIMQELGIVSFVNRYKQLTKIEFDLLGFFRLLVYGRILNPSSKISTVRQNDDYYNPILSKDFYEYNVYDTLSFVDEYTPNLLRKINTSLTKNFGRNSKIVYYDVTNFFFEIDKPDDDIEDEEGNIIEKGTRKNGVCKEERKLPIVQMGLFMDDKGLPISIEIFPGNTLDHQTLITSLTNTIDTMDLPKFIFVGDRGMCNGPNLLHLTQKNHGYVVSKSIAKTSAKEKEWIYSRDGYNADVMNFIDDEKNEYEEITFEYKSRIVNRYIKDPNTDLKTKITEKVVVYWSKKFYNKQLRENQSFLKFVEKLKENPSSFRISATQSKSLKKFLKDEVEIKSVGEIVDSKDLKLLIDDEKINEFKREMGYYQIVTSELEKSEKEIIEIYHGLSRIEDQFKIMKSDLVTRPIYVNTKEHIKAHLVICMISLLIMRIIQNKIVDYKNQNNLSSNSKYWQMGLTGERIQKALNKWQVDTLNNEYYRFNNLNNSDLKLILKSFDIDIPVKLFKKADLKSIKTNIKITT